jgi:hypothetical protein
LALVVIYEWQLLRDARGLPDLPGEQPAIVNLRDAPADRTVESAGSEPSDSAPASFPASARTVPEARVIDPRNPFETMVQLYPDLAQQLGISPEQEQVVYGILSQQQLDVHAAVVTGPDGQITEQSRREMDEIWARHNADVAAYVGSAAWRRWQEYETTLDARREVSGIVLSLVFRGQPLAESQKGPLLNDMIAEQQRRAQEEQLRTYPNMDQRAKIEADIQNLKGREESYQRIMSSAKVYLTPAQHQMIQESMTQQIQSKRAELNAQLARLNGGR